VKFPFLIHLIVLVTLASALKAEDELTPIGAEKQGNMDGSIPDWTSGLVDIPKGYNRKKPDVLPNPFAGEQPSYQINHKNLQTYQHLLSDGHAALLVDNPDSYVINVYPTHRSAGYPDSIYQATADNVGNISLNKGGSTQNQHSKLFGITLPVIEEVVFGAKLLVPRYKKMAGIR